MVDSAEHLASYPEYLALERERGSRHEFLAGRVFAMAGGTPEHDGLAANLVRLLGVALAGEPCAVHGSDLKLRLESLGVATYPDVTVVCDVRERSPVDENAIVNPRVVVEVTSPGTEAYDRGEKAELYRRIPTLDAYVLVAHDREVVEIYQRRIDGWRLTEFRAGQAAEIDFLGVSIPVDEIYRDPLGGNLVRPATRRALVP